MRIINLILFDKLFMVCLVCCLKLVSRFIQLDALTIEVVYVSKIWHNFSGFILLTGDYSFGGASGGFQLNDCLIHNHRLIDGNIQLSYPHSNSRAFSRRNN